MYKNVYKNDLKLCIAVHVYMSRCLVDAVCIYIPYICMCML